MLHLRTKAERNALYGKIMKFKNFLQLSGLEEWEKTPGFAGARSHQVRRYLLVVAIGTSHTHKSQLMKENAKSLHNLGNIDAVFRDREAWISSFGEFISN